MSDDSLKTKQIFTSPHVVVNGVFHYLNLEKKIDFSLNDTSKVKNCEEILKKFFPIEIESFPMRPKEPFLNYCASVHAKSEKITPKYQMFTKMLNIGKK